MRKFIGLVIVVAVIGGFLSHRKQEAPVATAPVANVAKAQPAPTRPNYEHDWAKNSLDRAGDVKRQVLQQRKENGNY